MSQDFNEPSSECLAATSHDSITHETHNGGRVSGALHVIGAAIVTDSCPTSGHTMPYTNLGSPRGTLLTFKELLPGQ